MRTRAPAGHAPAVEHKVTLGGQRPRRRSTIQVHSDLENYWADLGRMR